MLGQVFLGVALYLYALGWAYLACVPYGQLVGTVRDSCDEVVSQDLVALPEVWRWSHDQRSSHLGMDVAQQRHIAGGDQT